MQSCARVGYIRKRLRGNPGGRLITLMDKKRYRRHAKQSGVWDSASGISGDVRLSRDKMYNVQQPAAATAAVACRVSLRRTYLIKTPDATPARITLIKVESS